MDNIPMTTSPALIVVICAVAVVCLAVWLTAIMVAARAPRAPRRDSAALPGSVLGGTHLAAGGRSVAPNRDTAAVSIPRQRRTDDQPGSVPEAAAEAGPARGPAVPTPRGSDADRPAPTGTGA